MFRRDAPREMSTAEYAKFVTEFTGIKKTPQSVAYDCRMGKIECYREGDKGEWRITAAKGYVPIEDYNELERELDKAVGALKSIRKLAEF